MKQSGKEMKTFEKLYYVYYKLILILSYAHSHSEKYIFTMYVNTHTHTPTQCMLKNIIKKRQASNGV